MSNLSSLVRDCLTANGGADGSSELVVAGIRFSTATDAYFVNGLAVDQAAWQERLRGARELSRVVGEIYAAYPVRTPN